MRSPAVAWQRGHQNVREKSPASRGSVPMHRASSDRVALSSLRIKLSSSRGSVTLFNAISLSGACTGERVTTAPFSFCTARLGRLQRESGEVRLLQVPSTTNDLLLGKPLAALGRRGDG